MSECSFLVFVFFCTSHFGSDVLVSTCGDPCFSIFRLFTLLSICVTFDPFFPSFPFAPSYLSFHAFDASFLLPPLSLPVFPLPPFSSSLLCVGGWERRPAMLGSSPDLCHSWTFLDQEKKKKTLHNMKETVCHKLTAPLGFRVGTCHCVKANVQDIKKRAGQTRRHAKLM